MLLSLPVTPLYDEALLLIKLSTGDQDAFRMIYDHYRDKIYFFALKLIQEKTQTEEIVQEVFLKIWVHRDSVCQVGKFENYIYTITRNHTFNILKRHAHEKLITSEIKRNILLEDLSTENTIMSKDFQRILQETVEKLPPQQKMVYILSREKGLKRAEIAKELNITPETVKAHLYAAIKFIRANFKRPEHAFGLIMMITALKNVIM